ncbi:MAG: D-alanyl-D-alanine carboxypeptidase [Oscillospiraceae bacterium]|nr:D-alanyl-D-alanine carboxypeptidase [Oscillospiraceae bacterium]
MCKKTINNKILVIITMFIVAFACIVPYIVLASDDMYVWSDKSENLVQTDTQATTEQTGNFLNITSGSAVLMEQNTGKILYEYNAHEKLRPASVTKIMTLLLIMEAIDSGKLKYTDKIPCSEKARNMGGSQIWLDTTEQLTVDEMLKAICVVSANDCTVAMAEYLAGSEEAFVAQMNAKAKELGMNDTTFKNCHGLDEDGHVTSAYDIALMSRELLLKHPDITKYTTIWMDELRDGKSQLVNTNKLIKTYPGATGLKTGSTSVALYNLSASATRNDLNLIAVIMKADTSATRFAEATKLLDYGFNTYTFKEFAKAGDLVKNLEVEKGVIKHVDAVFKNDAGSLVEKGQENGLTQDIILDDEVMAPIEKGQILGQTVYKLNGKVIGQTDIIAKERVKRMNFINSLSYIFWLWFTLNR